MTKRILCALLATLMLLPIMVGCRKEEEPVDTEPTTEVVESQTETTLESESETEKQHTLELPEKDWGGREFVMMCRKARIHQYGYEEEVSFGATQLEKAIYTRNQTVETTYNVNLKYVSIADNDGTGWGNGIINEVAKSVEAGSQTYDVVAPDSICNLETKGYFENLNALEYAHFDAPWWWEPWTEAFTINGVQRTCNGWLSLEVVESLPVVYFNTQIMSGLETGYDTIYDAVYAGEWTIDLMIQLSKDATYNVEWSGIPDTTGALSDDYCHGTILHVNGLRAMLYSLGYRTTLYEDDGSIYLDYSTTKNQDVIDKLKGWIVNNPEVFYCSYNTTYGHGLGQNETPKVSAGYFTSGHALFYNMSLQSAALIAGAGMDFGVLPQPTMTEGEVGSTHTLGNTCFAIERQRTDDQKQFGLFILEALCYYNYTDVKPVYYEKTLKLQRAGADKEAGDMIDLAVNNAYIDVLCVAERVTPALDAAIFQGTSLSQLWISNGTKYQDALTKWVDGYLK